MKPDRLLLLMEVAAGDDEANMIDVDYEKFDRH